MSIVRFNIGLLFFILFLIAFTHSWEVDLDSSYDRVFLMGKYVILFSNNSIALFDLSNGKNLDKKMLEIRDIISRTDHLWALTSESLVLITPIEGEINVVNVEGLEKRFLENLDRLEEIKGSENEIILVSRDKRYIFSTVEKIIKKELAIDSKRELKWFSIKGKYYGLDKDNIYIIQGNNVKVINISNQPDKAVLHRDKIYVVDDNVLYIFDTNKDIVLSDLVFTSPISVVFAQDNIPESFVVVTWDGVFSVKGFINPVIRELKGRGGESFRIIHGENFLYAMGTNYIYKVDIEGVKRRYVLKDNIKDIDVENDIFAILYSDNRLEALKMPAGCVIVSPKPYEELGYKEINITVITDPSSYGGKVSINGGNWIESKEFVFDPNTVGFGVVKIECRSVGGVKYGDIIYLYRNPNASKKTFILKYNEKVDVGKTFSIRVYDENGKGVENFKVKVGDKEYIRSYSITLKFDEPGVKEIVITKEGFEDAKVYVEVKGGIPLWVIVLGVLIVLGIAYYIYRAGYI